MTWSWRRTFWVVLLGLFLVLIGCSSPVDPTEEPASPEPTRPEVRIVSVEGLTNELDVARRAGFDCRFLWARGAQGDLEDWVCWRGAGQGDWLEFGALQWESLEDRVSERRASGSECELVYAAEVRYPLDDSPGSYITIPQQLFLCWR